jgi:hypothetical protein
LLPVIHIKEQAAVGFLHIAIQKQRPFDGCFSGCKGQTDSDGGLSCPPLPAGDGDLHCRFCSLFMMRQHSDYGSLRLAGLFPRYRQ